MASRDPETLAALLSEQGWLDGLARALVGSSDADDVAQEAYLAALQRAPRALGDAQAPYWRGWLATVARNVVWKLRRSEGRRRERETLWSAERPLHDATHDVEERFALRHDLARALSQLDARQRQVILLRFVDDLTLREIAERVGEPLSTVDSRIRRGLALLREQMDADGGYDQRALAVLGLALPRASGRGAWLVAGVAVATLGIAGALGFALNPRNESPLLELPQTAVRRPQVGAPLGAPSARQPAAAQARDSASRLAADPHVAGLQVIALDPTGRAVPGVYVRPWPKANGAGRSVVPSAHTDELGTACFARLAPGAYRLNFDRAPSIEVTLSPGEQRVVRRQIQAGRVLGRVVDPQGQPVPDARVWVSAHPAGWLQEERWVQGEVDDAACLRADEDGRFTLDPLGQAVLIGALAPNRAPSAALRLRRSTRLDEPLVLTVGAAGASVGGRVVDAQGAIVARALVYLGAAEQSAREDPFPLRVATTDEGGEFEFTGVATGELQLDVQAPGLVAATQTLALQPLEHAYVILRAASGLRLVGTVRDARGAALAGAQVSASSAPWRSLPSYRHGQTTRTGADGAFTFSGLAAGPLWVSVRAAGFVDASFHVSAGAELDLTLTRAAFVTGRVIGEQGQGLAGCLARLAAGPAGLTDDAGRFRIAVDEAGDYALRIEEHGSIVYEGTARPDEEFLARVPAERRPSAVLHGHALHEQASVQLKYVELVRVLGNARPVRARVQQTGSRFESTPVIPGTYRIRVVATDAELELPGTWRLEPHARVDLGTLALEPALRQTLVLTGAAEVRDVHVWVRDERSKPVLDRRFPVARPPELAFALYPGTYEVIVASATTVPREMRWSVAAGLPHVHELELTAGAPHELRFLAPNSDPIFERLRLQIRAGTEEVLNVALPPSFRPDDPAYRVELGLEPGAYVVRGTTSVLNAERELHVGRESAQPAVLELQLER